MDPSPNMSVGTVLREARERRQLSMADCVERTRIRRKYLEALEEDRYAALPEDAYARSFVRTYADILGIDTTDIMERYDRDVATTTPSVGSVELRARDAPGGHARIPPRESRARRGSAVRRTLWALLGLMVVVVAGYFAARGLAVASPPVDAYFSR